MPVCPITHDSRSFTRIASYAVHSKRGGGTCSAGTPSRWAFGVRETGAMAAQLEAVVTLKSEGDGQGRDRLGSLPGPRAPSASSRGSWASTCHVHTNVETLAQRSAGDMGPGRPDSSCRAAAMQAGPARGHAGRAVCAAIFEDPHLWLHSTSKHITAPNTSSVLWL